MTRIGSQIQWLRPDELVTDGSPGEALARRPGPSRTTIATPFPLVVITRDRQLIAGRAYVEICRANDRQAIPCHVIDPPEIDKALTGIHHRILYSSTASEEFVHLLQLYTELCEYREATGLRSRGDAGE